MQNTPFQQANLALQEEVRRDFESIRDDVVQSINVMANTIEQQQHDLQREQQVQVTPPAVANNTTVNSSASNAELMAAV